MPYYSQPSKDIAGGICAVSSLEEARAVRSDVRGNDFGWSHGEDLDLSLVCRAENQGWLKRGHPFNHISNCATLPLEVSAASDLTVLILF